MAHRTGRMAGPLGTLACGASAIVLLLSPAGARAELMIPVTVSITEVVQLDADQDPGGFGIGQSLADVYAVVNIDGAAFSSEPDICDNPPPTPPEQSVFDVPYVFFNEEGTIVDPSCGTVPWTFTVDVPVSRFMANPAGLPVRIWIYDRDGGLGGDDDPLADFVLDVPFGGRWTGARAWPENCLSSSLAGVCWQIEAGQDSDGDGLLDEWEQGYVDVDGSGTFDPAVDLDLAALGADPFHKDLFLELDWRIGFPPRRAELQQVIEAFAAAPIDAGGVPNPDGRPGITLHVDTGELTENGVLVGENLGGGNELAAGFPVCSLSRDPGAFYPAKAANFDAARRGLVFRYGITSTQCCPFGPSLGTPCFIDAQCPDAFCPDSGGQAEIGGNDLVVWNTNFQGSTIMHEIGHTLGLQHGGDVSDNCKPNYLSIMNYDHNEIQRLDGSTVLDFSPARQPDGTRGTAPLPDLIEDAGLDEPPALDPADPHHLIAFTDPNRNKLFRPVGTAIDWNNMNGAVELDRTVNIDTSNADGDPEKCTNADLRTAQNPLTGHDDWTAVSLPFIQFGESSDGPVNPVEDPEPTDAEILRLRQVLNTADLAMTKSGPAGPVEAGAEFDLTYDLAFANEGPNPAVQVLVTDALPPGATVLALNPACVETAAEQVRCDLPALLPGDTAGLQLAVRAPARCAGGLPAAIVNQATIANAYQRAGPDPDPADNTARVETAVIDTTPPTLVLNVSPDTLWPPDHRLIPIVVTAESADACDDSPTIRLLSVTSDEPDDIPGSGKTGPDVQEAAVGTDDRQILLRAERSGGGDGRLYTLTYEAVDASGNATRGSITVTVPQSRR